ncbi:MAG TPA: HAMP domain-containing sensor histidine kinase [Candidatus Saccharimonadales bacterium]
MGLRRYFRTLKEQTVQNKLNIIIGLVILILLFGLLNFWFGMRVMSGIRAYVGGEGLWSKAEKAAIINLERYADSHDESDYREFLKNIEVQLGDKQARLEMNKPAPDMTVVRDGFIKGGNHPDDVEDMYFLYRHFRDVSYMKSAIQTWAEADQEIQNLLNVGNQIHELLSAPLPSNLAAAAQARQARAAELSSLLSQIYKIDARLTVLENQFSAILGEGSRWITKTLLTATITTTCLLGLLSLTVAIMIARAIVRLDRQKSEFVSLASHQLRTPLTAVKWSAELLARSADSLSPTQQKYIAKLHESSQRMAALIGDLLRVSSLDLGTYQSEEKEVKINGLLETAIYDQQKKIAQKNISLVTRIDPDVPVIKTDEQLLAIVFQNLISNSVKYSREGGRIEVNVAAKKEHLLIQVSDNGIGIPDKQQSQIFSKLFRADNAVEHSFNEGTGLGLYIAKAMVKRLGGKIWFDSVENSGSNFYVKIPL